MQVSAAEKKKQLNSKGEKGRGLLDVFTQPEPKEEQVVNNSKVEVVRKSPTPEVQEPVAKEEPMKEVTKSLVKMEIAPKVVEEEKKEKSPTPVKEEEGNEVKMEDKAVVEVKKAEEVVKPKQIGIPSLLDNIPMELRRDTSNLEEVTDPKEEKEDGELSEEEDKENENPGDGKNPKLKYDYKEDQWSHLNQYGKKQYDREFLICLQRDPLSLTKPNTLPAVEIVKDKPNQMGKPQMGSRIDFNDQMMTLLLFDSHIKTVNTKRVEEAIGGLLFTGKIDKGKRVYNSAEFSNMTARFPAQNLKTVLPKLINERPYQKLILQASCNDVSNAKHIQDVKELFEVGKLSSQNVVEAAKEALKMSFSLKEIIIIPRSPRIDDDKLAAVSDYANDCLFPLVAETLDKRIKLESVNSVPFKSEADKTDLFGLNGDGIHMRGRKGTAYYTDAIIDSILH